MLYEFIEMMKTDFDFKCGFISGIVVLCYMSIAMLFPNKEIGLLMTFGGFPVMAICILITGIIMDIHHEMTKKK